MNGKNVSMFTIVVSSLAVMLAPNRKVVVSLLSWPKSIACVGEGLMPLMSVVVGKLTLGVMVGGGVASVSEMPAGMVDVALVSGYSPVNVEEVEVMLADETELVDELELIVVAESVLGL